MPYRKSETPFAPPKIFCAVCGEIVDSKRVLKKAVTCSPEHYKALKNMRRRMRDTEKCRLCNRPSTPEERADFTRWRNERRTQETERRREEKKQQKQAEKEAAKAEAPTPIEEQLGTVTV